MESVLLGLLLLLPLLLWWRAASCKGGERRGLWLVVLISGTTALAYSQLGAFGQWQHAYVDQQIDLQLAGRITEARRQLKQAPDDQTLMAELVALYAKGGLYPEAVALQQQLIDLTGAQPWQLAQLAELQYYRDQRHLSDSTRQLLHQVFRQEPAQLQARLLLANVLFQRQQYAAAIAQWQWLLAQPQAEGYQQPLQNAIRNANALLAPSATSPLGSQTDTLMEG
ncbi:tetratricopeptide repeat protein [Shewanella sp. YIC-542]|uniref:tetratricopeptide repeat protein n=1 Tax=Shewanella mytili TaxID=3377111 RepID=UPI00398ED71A